MASRSAKASVSADVQLSRILIALSVFALALVGFVMVYSTTSVELINDGLDPAKDLVSQLSFAGVGLVAAVVLWKVPYRIWHTNFIWIAWGAGIVLIVLTALMGTELHGAKRWLQLGPIGLQPSEFAKISLLLMAIRIMYDFRAGEIEFRAAAVRSLLFVLVPLLFMYKDQSDLGTTLILAVGILSIMWVGGVPGRFMAGIVVIGVFFAFYSIFGEGYRADRMVYLNPWDDGEGGYGTGYNIIRMFYAIAEGGLFGVGIGGSHEKFQYLFASESDFIYAILCEELGMIGGLLVIALFLVILVSGMRISSASSDLLGQMIAAGFAIMLVAQAYLNIGCTIGVLPTTGKPLPFISSGGTSFVASMMMIGLILSVSEGDRESSVYERRRADLRVVRAERPSAADRSSREPSRSRRDGASSQRDRKSEQSRPGSRGASNRGTSRSSGSSSRRGSSGRAGSSGYSRADAPRSSRR